MKTLAALAVLALAVTPALPQNTSAPSVLVFRALLSPSHETPPVSGVNVSGEGTVEITRTYDAAGNVVQAIADFRVSFNAETPLTFTAMHIHRGAAGVAGPVVVDSKFGAQLPVEGSGSVFRQNVITDAAVLAVIEQIAANPAGYYLNMHSTSNPAGIIRGQLLWDASAQTAAQFQGLQMQLDRLELMVRNIGRALGLIFPATQ